MRLKKYILSSGACVVLLLLFWLAWNYSFTADSTSTESILRGNPHVVIWQEELPDVVNLQLIALDAVKSTHPPLGYRMEQVELTPVFVGRAGGKDVYNFRIFDWTTYEFRDVNGVSYDGEKSLPIQRGRHWGITIIRL